MTIRHRRYLQVQLPSVGYKEASDKYLSCTDEASGVAGLVAMMVGDDFLANR